MEVRRYGSVRDPGLREAWEQLQDGPDMTAFQRLGWNEVLEEGFLRNRLKRLAGALSYYVLYDGGGPVIVAPLHLQRASLRLAGRGYERGAYFVGSNGYTDYTDFVYVRYDPEQMDCLLSAVARDAGHVPMRLGPLRDGAPTASYLSGRGLSPAGGRGCVGVPLPGTYDEFLARTSKKLRQNVRTARSRAARDGVALGVRAVRGAVGDPAVVERVMEIREERFRSKNGGRGTSGGRLNALLHGGFNEVACSMLTNPDGWLLLGEVGGEIVSYVYGMRDGVAIRVMQLGFDSRYERYSPGLLTLIMYLEESYKEVRSAVSVLDFTRGEERYKYRLGGVRREVHDWALLL